MILSARVKVYLCAVSEQRASSGKLNLHAPVNEISGEDLLVGTCCKLQPLTH